MRRYSRVLSFTSALLAVVASCHDSSTAPDIATATFASALNVHLASMTKTSDGLYYQDSVIGTGATAAAGSSVTVGYHGWLVNDTTFDANTFGPFTLGTGFVIPGWDEGLVGMRVGGWRKLVIPPSLGYGNHAAGKIPANSILVFNVNLVASK